MHVLPRSDLPTPDDGAVAEIVRRVEATKADWIWAGSCRLDMPREKARLLIAIAKCLTDHYERTDLFEEWAVRLLLREELAATAGSGMGLGHQFQRPGEVVANDPEIDWWAFTVREGIDFKAPDERPVYLVVVPILAEPVRERELAGWAAASRLPKYVDPIEVASCSTEEAVRLLQDAVEQSLAKVRENVPCG